MRTLTLCWLALLALAVAGVLLGGAGDSPWLLAAVLACAVAKGWLIGERFMELAHAPALWRRLLLAQEAACPRPLPKAWPGTSILAGVCSSSCCSWP
ncbi:cytochrome C oxidase subunit IV family protein [Pseudomonas aeruginosa]|nr:cytochrome C oxidase subunit IV family protein [Pseudomonas aeruginosa]